MGSYAAQRRRPGLLTPVLPTCTHRSVVPESGRVGTTQGMS